VSRDGKKPAPKIVGPPKPFHVVFPEGFTRRQMAARIEAVAQIAKRERHVQPALSRSQYLDATARSPLPARSTSAVGRQALGPRRTWDSPPR